MRPMHSGMFAIKESRGWLLFNALGVGLYLAIELWIRAPRIPEEAFNGIDELCFWQTDEIPLLAFYLGANVAWVAMSCQHALFPRTRLLIFLPVCLIWGGVIAFDPIAVKALTLVIPMMIERAWSNK